MFALLSALVLASFPVSAAEPTFMRTPESPFMPFEEVSLDVPPNGCSWNNRCIKVLNTGSSWLALEVPNKGTSSIKTNRVVEDGVVVIGVYLDELPILVNMVTVTLSNQQIVVPAIAGRFMAAIPPCIGGSTPPTGYMKVDSDPTLVISGTGLDFDGNDRETTLAFDVTKNILVRVPLGGFARTGGTKTKSLSMFYRDGSPSSLFTEGWQYIEFGGYDCPR